MEWQDGLRETILFILEEETDWHRFSLHRLGSYCFELADLCKSDCVVPVVIFLREADSVPASLSLGAEHQPYVERGIEVFEAQKKDRQLRALQRKANKFGMELVLAA